MPEAERVAARLAVRAVRVATLILSALVVLMVLAANSSPRLGASLTELTSTPAIRALYGAPFDLTTTGGLYAWRYGAVFAAIISVWAVLASTRLLRGEEETGRAEILLAAPLRRTALAARDVGVVGGACLVVGVVTTVAMIAVGQAPAGSILLGAATALIGVVFAAVGGVAAQLFGQRRRAAGAAGLVIGAAFVVRMGADGSSSLQWLRWATPFGWIEEVRPFGGDHWYALLPLVAAAAVLVGLALWLVGRRDVGAGVLQSDDSAKPRLLLLGGAVAFNWRQRRGSMAAWAAGLVVWGAVMGSVTTSMAHFIASNQAFRQLASSFGFGNMATAGALIAVLDAMVALVVSLYAISSVHLLWEDEETGRLEAVFSQRVRRRRWLGAVTVVTVAGTVALTFASGLSTWAVARIGGADVTFAQASIGAANTLPLVLVFVGLAVFVFGIRPGPGAAVCSGAALAAYLLGILGPALKLPDWVTDLTPFRHMSLAPVAPVAWGANAIMLAVAAALAAAGFLAYARRDLH